MFLICSKNSAAVRVSQSNYLYIVSLSNEKQFFETQCFSHEHVCFSYIYTYINWNACFLKLSWHTQMMVESFVPKRGSQWSDWIFWALDAFQLILAKWKTVQTVGPLFSKLFVLYTYMCSFTDQWCADIIYIVFSSIDI